MEENTVVTFTTIPERIQFIPRVLNSLRNQTIKPSKIYIHVPKISRKGKYYDIDKIQELVKPFNDINVIINILDHDEGPITKFVPILDLEKNPNTNIIIIDDDCIYNKKIIETLLKYKDLEAVGFSGANYNSKNKKIESAVNLIYGKTIKVDFLETYLAVLYKRKLFPATTKDFTEWMHKFPEICLFNDDIIIGAWLDLIDQSRYLLPFYSYFGTKCNSGNSPKLSTDNLKGRNEKIFHIMHGDNYVNESLKDNDKDKNKISLSILGGNFIIYRNLFYKIIVILTLLLIICLIYLFYNKF